MKQKIESLNSQIEGMNVEKLKLNEELEATKDMVMINLKIKKQDERD